MEKTGSREKSIYVSIGRGGCTVHFGKHSRLQTYGNGWKKYTQPGTPVIDTQTIPQDKIARWALLSPMVDLEAETSQSKKVEQNDGGMSTGKHAWMFNHIKEHGHPEMRRATFGNLATCTLEDYMKLAAEWGATVYIYQGE